MTEGELRRIEEREKKASPGPWEWNGSDPSWLGAYNDEFHLYAAVEGLSVESCRHRVDSEDLARSKANREFVAHSRGDVRELLREVRFQMSQNAELARGTEILVREMERLREENRKLALENAGLVKMIPVGYTFHRDGECKLIE